jgi:hypothetical protein
MSELIKSKTVWTGVAGLVTAAAGYFTGEMDLVAALQTALASLAAIFMRQAVAKR